MSRADLSSPRGTRLGVIVLVALLHVAAILALVRAFAPEFTQQVADQVVAVFNVTVTAPEPTPTPSAVPEDPVRSGAAAEAGKKATPKEVSAPKPKIELTKTPAPQVAAKGDEVTSGARDQGEGTGAGGEGAGTGSGTGGDGQGAGGGSEVVKLSGDINSARDYPRKSRDLRVGDYVIVALTVGTDGRVKACRVHRASRDPDADRITCDLAKKRFRFRPATNADGKPVESVYGWKQRWFYPEKGN